MNSPLSLASTNAATRGAIDARPLDQAEVTPIGSTDPIAPAIDEAALTDRRSAGSVKARIDGLIDQQVSRGTLTEEQAAGLQGFFAHSARGGPAASVRGALDEDRHQLTTLVDKMRRSLAPGVTYGNNGADAARSGLLIDGTA